MVSRKYWNYDLQIERRNDQFRVRVLDSPEGQETGFFDLPFSKSELDTFASPADRSLPNKYRGPTPEAGPKALLEPAAFGRRLYQAVFAGNLDAHLRLCLRQAEKAEAGLRIRLRLNDVPELAVLPWEYLSDPRTGRAFALSDQTPLVRYLEPLQKNPARPLLILHPAPMKEARNDSTRFRGNKDNR